MVFQWCTYRGDPVPRAPQPNGISASLPALLVGSSATDAAREVRSCRPSRAARGCRLPDGACHCSPFYPSRVTVCSSTHEYVERVPLAKFIAVYRLFPYVCSSASSKPSMHIGPSPRHQISMPARLNPTASHRSCRDIGNDGGNRLEHEQERARPGIDRSKTALAKNRGPTTLGNHQRRRLGGLPRDGERISPGL